MQYTIWRQPDELIEGGFYQNPQNVLTDDLNYARWEWPVDYQYPGYSGYLVTWGAMFELLPDDALIRGIEVRILSRIGPEAVLVEQPFIYYYTISLVDHTGGGTIGEWRVFEAGSMPVPWTSEWTWKHFGDSNDLWGADVQLTADYVRQNPLGMLFDVESTPWISPQNAGYFDVAKTQMRVWYETAPTPQTVSGMKPQPSNSRLVKQPPVLPDVVMLRSDL